MSELVVLPPEVRNALMRERRLRGWGLIHLAMTADVAASSVARVEAGIPVPASLVRAILKSVHMAFPGDHEHLRTTG